LEGIATIILAAGKGTRMKSDLVKVLHPLLGLPMLSYTVDLSLSGIEAEKTIVVVGFQADQIRGKFQDPRILLLSRKNNCAQAMRCFRPSLILKPSRARFSFSAGMSPL